MCYCRLNTVQTYAEANNVTARSTLASVGVCVCEGDTPRNDEG